MSSYLPPTDNLQEFNPAVFQSNTGNRVTTTNTTTGITYASGTTTIDNNVIIGTDKTLSLPVHNHVDTALTTLETKTKHMIDASGLTRFNTRTELSSDQGVISNTNSSEKGTLHIYNNTSTQDFGDGALGTSISLSGVNSGRRGAMIASFQDGGGDVRTTGLKVFCKSVDTNGTDTLTETLEIKSNGDLNVARNLDVTGYRSRLAIVTYNPNNATNDLWGNDNRHKKVVDNYRIGSSFCDVAAYGATNQGRITFSEAGTYRVKVHLNVEMMMASTTTNNNNRVVFGAYISKDGSTDWKSTYAGWGLCYLRDDTYGFGNSIAIDCVIGDIISGSYITINTKINNNSSAALSYADEQVSSNFDVYCTVEIEKLASSNVVTNV